MVVATPPVPRVHCSSPGRQFDVHSGREGERPHLLIGGGDPLTLSRPPNGDYQFTEEAPHPRLRHRRTMKWHGVMPRATLETDLRRVVDALSARVS